MGMTPAYFQTDPSIKFVRSNSRPNSQNFSPQDIKAMEMTPINYEICVLKTISRGVTKGLTKSFQKTDPIYAILVKY
jgi:hypothetical protein